MKLHARPLRQKLLAIVLLTTFAALFVAFLGTIATHLWSLHRSLVADLRTQSELLGRMTAPALIFDDPKLATQNLQLLQSRSRIRAAAIYTERGSLFARYAAPGNASAFPTLPEADGERIEGGNLIVFRRIVQDGSILGTVYLRADYDLRGALLGEAGLLAIVTAFAMLTAFFLISRLERVLTAPIFAITSVARDIAERRDYSRRAEKISEDEIGMLATSFNDMLAEIERRTAELEVSSREMAREAEERTLAQREVMRLNTDLERRVRERTAELEQATAAAEEANRAKSAFLSSMSHELRTPLNAILGFAEILVTDSMPTTLQQKKDFTQHIIKAGRHLLTLINEILDLAKIESGALSLSLEPVALDEILAECREMIEPLGQERQLQTIFPPHQGLAVQADRTRLKQVLLNLLSNAVKYNRPAGSVAVECTTQEGGQVRIWVRDTGIGLTPAQLDKLFQPFNRLGQEAGLVEGTGIGLVVTRRLVELMGGSIGVSSNFGIGSVFWIDLRATPRLPVAHDKGPLLPDAHLSPLPADPARQTVLYIEDNPANLKLVEEILRFRADVHLLSAPDAHLGIELAAAHLPRVILMDINLPGMSGVEALQILRQQPATAHIPVIAVTANAMPRDISAGLASGFFRYLTKPIRIEELNDAIDQALRQAKEGKMAG